MSIRIDDPEDLLTEDIRMLAERRLLFALSRFDSRISGIKLAVSSDSDDEQTTSCRLTIRLTRGDDVLVTDRDTDRSKCVTRVANKAGRAIARAIERTRQFDQV